MLGKLFAHYYLIISMVEVEGRMLRRAVSSCFEAVSLWPAECAAGCDFQRTAMRLNRRPMCGDIELLDLLYDKDSLREYLEREDVRRNPAKVTGLMEDLDHMEELRPIFPYGPQRTTALMKACENNKWDAAKMIIEFHDIHYPISEQRRQLLDQVNNGQERHSALHVAAIHWGYSSKFRIRGFQLESNDHDRAKQLEVIQMLVARGARAQVPVMPGVNQAMMSALEDQRVEELRQYSDEDIPRDAVEAVKQGMDKLISNIRGRMSVSNAEDFRAGEYKSVLEEVRTKPMGPHDHPNSWEEHVGAIETALLTQPSYPRVTTISL